MALTAQIDAITQKHIMPDFYASNVLDSQPFLKYLQEKKQVKVQSGTAIRVPVPVAEAAATGWFKDYDTLNVSPNDVISGADFGWKKTYASIIWNGTELDQNDGPEGIVRLVKVKKEIAKETLKKNVEVAIFGAGTDALKPDGLRLMCAASGQYPATTGGISPVDFSGWAGKVDSTTGQITRPWLDTRLMTQAGGGDDYPDLMVMRPSCLSKILSDILGPQQRVENDGWSQKLGARVVSYNNVLILTSTNVSGSDGGTADNHIHFLNTKYIQWVINTHNNYRQTEVQMAINQDAYYQKIFLTCNLICWNRRRQGQATAINPSL